MDRIKDSGSFDQGSIPCGFTNIRLKLLIINLRRFLLRNYYIFYIWVPSPGHGNFNVLIFVA